MPGPAFASASVSSPIPAAIPESWPNAANTGYRNAPDYPGHLTTYSDVPNGTECSGPIQSGRTYRFCHFPNGIEIGTADLLGTPSDVTFYGCLFEAGFDGYGPGSEALVKYSNGNNIVFSYDTFKPAGVAAPPVSYEQGVEYGVNQVESAASGYGAGSFSIDHSEFWGLAAAVEMGASSQSQPVTIRDSYIHDTRADGGGIDHTDGILSNDGQGVAYVTIDHNTIVSTANNEGIALQFADYGYDHVSVTNNYLSGWHMTVDFGGYGTGNTNDTFTGNVFASDLQPTAASFYVAYGGDGFWHTNLGNVWRNNTFYVVPGSGYTPTSDNGRYWLPQWTDQGWPALSDTDWAQ